MSTINNANGSWIHVDILRSCHPMDPSPYDNFVPPVDYDGMGGLCHQKFACFCSRAWHNSPRSRYVDCCWMQFQFFCWSATYSDEGYCTVSTAQWAVEFIRAHAIWCISMNIPLRLKFRCVFQWLPMNSLQCQKFRHGTTSSDSLYHTTIRIVIKLGLKWSTSITVSLGTTHDEGYNS